MARAQIKFETGQLCDETLLDVTPTAKLQANKLRDIARVTVPDVRKTVDRLRGAMKNYANCRNCDVTMLVAAQDKCETALKWINQVEKRLQTEQIYLDQKQPERKVDFVAFASGTAVSIYEFFMKFEAWARGRLSKDTMANVLYSEYLDKTITHGNKELEEIKLSYHSMKAWLLRMYGRPDTVADLYLKNIRKVKPLAGKSDVAGSCRLVKEVYGHVITLTTLEESEGLPVIAVSEHIYRNQFLKALVAVLPKTTHAQFMQKLEDEDLHVIAGKPYIRDIIALLKNEYRRLEIEAEIDATERGQKAVKAASAHQVSVNPQPSSES
jgi:CRISPR/Cas system CSM-associated protein Csm2 small subunit